MFAKNLKTIFLITLLLIVSTQFFSSCQAQSTYTPIGIKLEQNIDRQIICQNEILTINIILTSTEPIDVKTIIDILHPGFELIDSSNSFEIMVNSNCTRMKTIVLKAIEVGNFELKDTVTIYDNNSLNIMSSEMYTIAKVDVKSNGFTLNQDLKEIIIALISGLMGIIAGGMALIYNYQRSKSVRKYQWAKSTINPYIEQYEQLSETIAMTMDIEAITQAYESTKGKLFLPNNINESFKEMVKCLKSDKTIEEKEKSKSKFLESLKNFIINPFN